ncbi:MAG: type II toxin-antitoxin system VapC family toxin [Bacillota bacterium]
MFVDTSGWCALFDASDQNHGKAAQLWREISGSTARLYTSDYVLDETITLIRKKIDHESAVKFGRAILESRITEILWVTEDVWEGAWSMFQKYRDKDFSFTDCTSFVLMKKHGVDTAFVFDHHFTQAGFLVVPLK